MSQSAQQFAELLQEGITSIADRTSKPKGVIRDELGYAIGRSGGSAIEYWAYGDGRIPKEQSDVAELARVLVDAGNLDHAWLASFLESAGYPNRAGLTAELFPDTLAHPLRNLPLPSTPLVGRNRELTDLVGWITDPVCRLATLVGPGGSGKTRLAIEAARNKYAAFSDGAAFVALAPLSSANLIVPAVAAALGLTLDGRATSKSQLLRYLRRQEMLLVLDNFEHLLTPSVHPQMDRNELWAVTPVISLLEEAPGVTMLVTTRERLNLQGEWVYEVGGLEVPTEEAEEEEVDVTNDYSAPVLFLQAAQRIQANFVPTATDRTAILHICRLVAGMPLALELAAAWVRMLSCREIATEIEKNLDFLTATQRNLPSRHRSMQAVFDHSWRLLSAEEQQAFASCSVFRGGFKREAAADVADASLLILTALVDKSLLSRNGDGRYAIHELARQYAAERLSESQQEAQARDRHLAYFMKLSEEAEPRLRSGPQIVQWHDRIEIEQDNLRTALDWAFTDGEFELGLRMVGAMWQFWMNRGYLNEGQAQAERFLARPEAASPTYVRAKALDTAATLALYQGEFQTAKFWGDECVAVSRGLGPEGKLVLVSALITKSFTSRELHDFDAMGVLSQEIQMLGRELQNDWVMGHAFLQLAYVARVRDDDTRALHYFRKSFEAFQADGQSIMRSMCALRLGELYYEQSDYENAHIYFSQSLVICEEMGDPNRSSHVYRNLGKLAMVQGKFAEAEELLTKALGLIPKAVYLSGRSSVLDLMGRLAQQRGDYAQAQTLHRESLTIWGEIGAKGESIHAVEGFACLAARQGQAERATLLFSATETLYAAATVQWKLLILLGDPIFARDREQLIARTWVDLGEPAFSAAWTAGAEMALEEAVAYALESIR